MSNSDEEGHKPVTHEERLKLAARLDRELDEFINSLEGRRYTEGWPEDRWEEVRFFVFYIRFLFDLFIKNAPRKWPNILFL